MKNDTVNLIDKKLDSLDKNLTREHNLLVGLRREIIDSMSDTSITIEGIEYYISKPVFDLMIKTSKERDYYRDIVNRLENAAKE